MERRVRIVSLAYRDVLEWFTCALQGWPEFVRVPRIEGVPSDAKVLGVHHNFYTHRFDFLIKHESFDLVPAGDTPPGDQLSTRVECLEIVKEIGPLIVSELPTAS